MPKPASKARPTRPKVNTNTQEASVKPPQKPRLRSALKTGSSDSTSTGKSVEWDPAITDGTMTMSTNEVANEHWVLVRSRSATMSDSIDGESDVTGTSSVAGIERESASVVSNQSADWDIIANDSPFDASSQSEASVSDPAIVDRGPAVSPTPPEGSDDSAFITDETTPEDRSGPNSVSVEEEQELYASVEARQSPTPISRGRIGAVTPSPICSRTFPGYLFDEALREALAKKVARSNVENNKRIRGLLPFRAGVFPQLRQPQARTVPTPSVPRESQDVESWRQQSAFEEMTRPAPTEGVKRLDPQAPDFRSARGTHAPAPLCAPDAAVTAVSSQVSGGKAGLEDQPPAATGRARQRVIYDDPAVPGREVDAFELWYAELQLEEFTKRYPLTGSQGQLRRRKWSSSSSSSSFISAPARSSLSQVFPGHPALIQEEIERSLLWVREREVSGRGSSL
ncbi:MAG: hypothetical protein M1818_003849 [Claussenomyces sp. TS43310]|nr:MAG: hypothetical protein M1818_003849 [Claussenomyces sp. TS43310]